MWPLRSSLEVWKMQYITYVTIGGCSYHHMSNQKVFCWILFDLSHNFLTWSLTQDSKEHTNTISQHDHWLTQDSKEHTNDGIDRASKSLIGKSSYYLLSSLNFPNYDQWYVPMFQRGYVAHSIKVIWVFWVIR